MEVTGVRTYSYEIELMRPQGDVNDTGKVKVRLNHEDDLRCIGIFNRSKNSSI